MKLENTKYIGAPPSIVWKATEDVERWPLWTARFETVRRLDDGPFATTAESDCAWLAGRLSDPTIRVVDARSDKDFSSGHIPAAVNINGFWLGGIRPGSEMPKPEAFAHLVGPLGIDEPHRSSCTTKGDGPSGHSWRG